MIEKNLVKSFRKNQGKIEEFDSIKIALASPELIRSWSHGEVKKPETINYRTYKPERDGLFCAKIFGPVKDFECLCGKYKRLKHRGVICEKCGVEVTQAKVRRERMGHIELASPVAHIWFLKSLPSRIGNLLDMKLSEIERVLYFESYVVVDTGLDDKKDLRVGQLLTEEEYREMMEKYEGDFTAMMGAEAILKMLQEIDLEHEIHVVKELIDQTTSEHNKKKYAKRLKLMEAFLKSGNKPEWMILTVLPVLPPDLRPLVPLDGGRFATSDLNDLYRRVINRNNRLRRLLDLAAPDIIVRNEKRMLQEAVDALLDNGRRGRAITGANKRALKSLADMIKGKQGRFRQNLLGKRVDYSGRSVITVGPFLRLHQCGLPKKMALELFKPFILGKLQTKGYATTIKAAKKMVEREEPQVWDILEEVIREHPVLLNRAPTLHRLGIQAFEPILIEGKAIRLHPLVCSAFNADFDGDQMAVHLPLSNEAILEAQLLMLQSHNILSPASGEPITVPSQDMVLGLYYISKVRPGAKGEGLTFYGPEEAIIAFNEGKVDVHALIKCVVRDIDENGNPYKHLVETTVGRIIINDVIPEEIGFVNEVIGKKALKKVITRVIKGVGMARACEFLDGIKNLGYRKAYEGGLSFVLDDIIIPAEKEKIVQDGHDAVDQITMNYQMGLITDKDRYQQVVETWTKVNDSLKKTLMKQMTEADQGFNAVFMMLDSGARGSADQISQLAGMRGLMAKPQKAGASDNNIIENPILSNFKEGMSVLEYFISTHGARKGLADTALKTADAGYLTRRLVDVSHDVIVNEEDCDTLRGLICTALKDGDRVVASLADRILGRVSVHDIVNPKTNELIVASGEEITDRIAAEIEGCGIESVEIRSVLTCESKKGVCMKCYGRNLATQRMVQKGEAVGVIAAQAIGEPGTQLTLRTFHAGGVAGNAAANAQIKAKNKSKIEIDELRTVARPTAEHPDGQVVVGRLAELRFLDLNTGIILSTVPVPYGANLYAKSGDTVEAGQIIADWDPFNSVIVTEFDGVAEFEGVKEGLTYRVDVDETTGLRDLIVTEAKDRAAVPYCHILDKKGGELLRTYSFPINGHIIVEDGQKLKAGDILVKIPRSVAKAGDITGGLPRVTELFEARNPSNPAIVAEIDGEVTMGKVKRGNREIILTSKVGDVRKYLVSLSKQILVQEHDAVRAGTPLSDGVITPADILAIKGPTAVQEYIVNEVQDVYRLQGVKINDKHFEIIVRQMMRKVEINDPGDTTFLEQQIVDKLDFAEENDRIWGKKVVVDAGDSENLQKGQIVTARKLRDENSSLKRRDMKLVQVRDAVPATSTQILQGITRAALQTKSFMSAASFQETTKVLNEAAIRGKSDNLEGMKENVIAGHLIPAGTGLREFDKIIVGSKEEYERMQANKKNVLDFGEENVME